MTTPNVRKQRYSLAELLQSVKPEDIQALKEDTEWFRESASRGREFDIENGSK